MNRIYPNSEQKDLSTVIVYNVSDEPGGPLFYDEEGTKPSDADYIFELAIRNLLVICRPGHDSALIPVPSTYYFPFYIVDNRVNGFLVITSYGERQFLTFECAKEVTAEVAEPDPEAEDPDDDAHM